MGPRQNSRRKRGSKALKTQSTHTFAVDERVLCYEPDIKKARVLYDSKVLEVVERKNQGKIRVEYKIHFFGWNSSWDRYVDEEFVLKDTDENRALQKELKEKADELLQTHVKKKKRKKTLSEILKEATNKDKGGTPSTSKGTPEDMSATQPFSSDSSSSDDDDDDDNDEEVVVPQIQMSEYIQGILKRDNYNVNWRNMLMKLPAPVSVAGLLETYVKKLGFLKLAMVITERDEKLKTTQQQQSSTTLPASLSSSYSVDGKSTPGKGKQSNVSIEHWIEEIDRLYRVVRQAHEVVHGLRTMFDFTLYQRLLYAPENEQYESLKKEKPFRPIVNCLALIEVVSPTMRMRLAKEMSSKPEAAAAEPKKDDKHQSKNVSAATTPVKSGSASEPGPSAGTSIGSTPTRSKTKSQSLNQPNAEANELIWQRKVQKYINTISSWQIMPNWCYEQDEPDPSTMYGVVHFVRFCSHLAPILVGMRMPKRKSSIIINHANQLLEHIEQHFRFSTKEWYVPRIQPDVAAQTPPRTKSKPCSEETPGAIKRDARGKILPNPLIREKAQKNRRSLLQAVELEASSADGGIDEHRLTVAGTPRSATTTAPVAEAEETLPEKSSVAEKVNEPLTVDVCLPVAMADIKQELPTPPIKREKVEELKKYTDSKKVAKKPPLPPQAKERQRYIRESAANAVAKNAHIFASQQNFSSRSGFQKISGSTKKKLVKLDEISPVMGGKRQLERRDDSPRPSPTKRITRRSSASLGSSPAISSKEASPQRRESRTSTPERFPDSLMNVKIKDEPSDQKKPSTSQSSSKPKITAKTITSPRTSKAGSPHKELSPPKSPPKSPHSPSSSIRLRSKSGERQLRSKGSLINAISLPLQAGSRVAKPNRDKSPKRRESVGSGTKETPPVTPRPQQGLSPALPKSEPARNLRSRR